MRNDNYPQGTAASLLQTDYVKPITKRVLESRYQDLTHSSPVFFSDTEFKLLKVISNLLIPQDSSKKVSLAVLFDRRLSSGKGKGWRYDALPPDKELFRAGLKGIEEMASAMYAEKFIFLSYERQHNVLSLIQSGEATGFTWQQLSSALFFRELLAALTELYYSHPTAKDEIGEVAYADATGWDKIGLNEHEPFEPLPLKIRGNA